MKTSKVDYLFSPSEDIAGGLFSSSEVIEVGLLFRSSEVIEVGLIF